MGETKRSLVDVEAVGGVDAEILQEAQGDDAQDDEDAGRPTAEADIACFASFYRDQYRMVVTMLMLVCGASVEESEDAAQSAFASLYNHWMNVAYPKKYVRTSAIRAFIKGRQQAGRTVLLGDAPQDRGEADDELDGVTGWAWVEWVIKDLPLGQQRVMRAVTEGLSYDQISSVLGITTTNVRSHLRHVRNRLKTRPELLNLAAATPSASSAPTPGKGKTS
ncbi:RNA polymerase sigma factor [Nonomuraea rubra]|uniref:RNA polymerase sigma factor n=1 Tax=Nonomuraea rubra TaxID=46180 RepID=UPI00340E98AE